MSHEGDTVLEIDHLRAFHTSKDGIVKAVNDVSFSVMRGEAVGLLGESGSGKSSIALSIIGLFEHLSRYYATSAVNKENKKLWSMRDKARKKGQTSKDVGMDLPGVEGHIWFDGLDLLTLNENEQRTINGNRITYVPQGTSKSLNPNLSIENQTLEVLWSHFKDKVAEKEDLVKRVLEILDVVELGDMAIRRDMFPDDFSTGEDQRILIAMALISQPELFIADEPTTALDTGVRYKILEAINTARKELGFSVLMLSNDVGIITETCDRVGMMSAGMLMEFGEMIRILKDPIHPFTQAFMMSNPTMEMLRRMRERGQRLRPIPGRPPSLINLPSGCPFHPRCNRAEPICKEKLPEFREIEPKHWVMCHLV